MFKNQQVSFIRQDTFSPDDDSQSIKGYLCAESMGDDSSYENNYFHELLQQAHEARIQQLAEKNLESITIEKNQKITAHIQGGSEINSNVDGQLEDMDSDHQQFQAKLSEEMYGSKGVPDKTETGVLLNRFCQLLDQLQVLWDQILKSKKQGTINQSVKTIPLRDFRVKVGNSSPYRGRKSPPIKKPFDSHPQDPANDLLKILQKENASLQLDRSAEQQVNLDFAKLITKFPSNRNSPLPREAPKYLKPLEVRDKHLLARQSPNYLTQNQQTRMIRFNKDELNGDLQWYLKHRQRNSSSNQSIYQKVNEALKQTKSLILQLVKGSC